ncbi:MAG: hypothetical protein SGI90_06435 [Candidatus Eisenbacteria bacterium]|nr:hypothetical protein [Candidatus Eisenbacteria bacterium]
MPAPPKLRAAILTLAATAAVALTLHSTPSDSQQYIYANGDSLNPRIQYEDGTISLNDRCAVRMTKLAKRMRPVYVNGQPIGFC